MCNINVASNNLYSIDNAKSVAVKLFYSDQSNSEVCQDWLNTEGCLFVQLLLNSAFGWIANPASRITSFNGQLISIPASF